MKCKGFLKRVEELIKVYFVILCTATFSNHRNKCGDYLPYSPHISIFREGQKESIASQCKILKGKASNLNLCRM